VQLSPTSSDDDDDDVARQSDAASTTSSVQQTPANTAADEQTVTRDGTKWTIVTQTALTGRFQSQNVFTAKPGPTAYARTVTSPVDAFGLLIDEGMLHHIKRCTVEYARTKESTWEMADAELDTFLGLLYLRGVMNAKNFLLIYSGQTSMAVRPSARQCLEIASDKSSHSSDSTAEVLAARE